MVKKIDFHIHTVSSSKDYDFTYSSKWLQEYVNKAELDAIAITNHDLFDKDNYELVKKDLPNTVVFPGIELSLEEGHVNIIFSEENIPNLIRFSDWLANHNKEKYGKVSVESFCENMENWEDGIYIFELGKSNSLSVPEKLKNVCYVGGVSNQLKFQLFYRMNDGLTPVLFSDAHADDNDPEIKRRDIEILKKKNTYLQVDNCTFKEIKSCISEKTKVGINKNYLSDVIDIDDHVVSTGLNLIVGKRGTGKTHFLKTIKKNYSSEDIYEISQFETSKSEKYIENQRRIQGYTAINSWKKQYRSQFNSIQKYLDTVEIDFDSEVDRFIESVKKFAKDTTASNSTAKYKLIKEASFEEISIKNLEVYLRDLNKLINSNELWLLVKNSSNNKRIFITMYNELKIVYAKKKEQNFIQKEVNKILDTIKEIVQSKTGITPVTNCEFTKIIQNNQTSYEISKFMQKIICETELKRENVYGYQIVVKLTPFLNATQFRKDLSLNEGVQEDLIVPYKSGQYIKFFKISNLVEYLLHLEVKLLDSDGIPASGGQTVGFALMMKLEEAKFKSIVLIDEPEASLDNAYIKEELIYALKNISKNSTVFVVTHNSTLGTLLIPDYLIVTTKNKKNYHVLTGEFSSHTISNRSEYSDFSENSYDKFVEAMEAGIETYNRKGEIYESFSD